MILTDAGPLIALINRNDPHHGRCVKAAQHLPAEPLLTTWPCFTEAAYLLGKAGGPPAQARLWALWTADRLVLHPMSNEETARSRDLMNHYRDLPMDLADATLLAVAEDHGHRRVFTVDGDFHIYRMKDGGVLQVVP